MPTTAQSLRTFAAYFFSAAACYVLASLSFTTANLIRLAGVGAELSLGDVWRTALFDMRGMAPTFAMWSQYGSVIFIALAIAFPVAAALRLLAARYGTAGTRVAGFLYPLGGATAIAVALVLMYQKYEVVAIPGARGTAGFLAQCAAGAAAGYIFQRLLSESRKAHT